MPELPEVEVVRRGLESAIDKKTSIKDLQFLRADLRDPIPIKRLKTLVGAKIQSVERRAKYLILKTAQGSLVSHLGMTGIWRISNHKTDLQKHDHAVIELSNGAYWIYNDPRRFGVIDFVAKSDFHFVRFAELGIEPLSQEFTGQYLWQQLRGKDCALKSAIMDQRVVVGVGNIYASEALFMAGIRPNVKAGKISLKRAENLVTAIKQVLSTAIEAGGSSISDFRHISGASGKFQNQHQVYDRADLSCRICATPIRKSVIVGRSTFWCPQCQL